MTDFIQRRDFLKLMAASGVLAVPGLAWAAGEAAGKQTHVYKSADKVEIRADVYGASPDKVRPAVIWIHGGALIMGHRAGIDPVLRDKLLKAGYVVVSIDYRLAPEVKLPAILEDVQDACKWVRGEGAKRFGIDPKKIAVMGGSAGGYLTLTTGYRVEPPPQALVAFWGYGDVDGPWYSKPDPFYRTKPLVPKEEAYKAVGGPVLTDSNGKPERGRFYLYCRQNGLWPKEVTGHDPEKEPRVFDAFCPIRNVSAKYPPTMLIHGTRDTDVPYELSAMMAKELASKKVEHELITVTDAGHGLAGVKRDEVARIYDRAVAFIDKHLGR